MSKPAFALKQALKHKNPVEKHQNCEICSSLPDNYNCEIKFVVYQFTCNHCHKSYIGKTSGSRPFYLR